MGEQFDISIIISTYNRCDLLPGALKSVLTQRTDGVRYEVVIVDNNSKDRTRQVVESFIANGYDNLRYVFEGKQGISHGRNAGVMSARAPVIAFTDDDVHVSPDWVASIKRAFDEHPGADGVGGKVLAQWEREPPSWLTRECWSPLALLDYGDEPFYVNAQNQRCLITANAAFRREMIERVGMFSPRFQHIGVCSVDDHEFLLRFWQAGGQALYDPRIVVIADVQAERMEKLYHRKWHTAHGRQLAKMWLEEIEKSNRGRLFDVPAHLYMQAVRDAARWAGCSLRGRQDDAFLREAQLRSFVGFFRQRRKDYLAEGQPHGGTVRELASFVRTLASRNGRRETPKESG
ncbi:MAG: glycosyltransferase family 2 protein [Acidobacteriota bacterium]|nr:glycosyltransferase family 2 protein [Acidobacteriota bacterium]